MALTDIVSHATLKTGLLAYYKLEGNARDSWGTNNGTAEKAITTTTGKLLNCISFDGTWGENYAIGQYQALNLGQILATSASFSIAFWINPNDQLAYAQLASIYHWTGSAEKPGCRFSIQQKDTDQPTSLVQASYIAQTGRLTTSDILYTFGIWTHWSVTVDYNSGTGVTTLSIYKNGYLANQQVGSIGGMISGTIPMLIGAMCNGADTPNLRGQIVNGKLDEIAIANRAWTAGEVADLYNSSNALPLERQPSVQNHPTLKTGLVSYWALEGNANDTYGSHPGSLVNSPTEEYSKIRKGYRFNGSTQGMRVAHHSDLVPTQFSIALWAKNTGGSGFRFLFSKESTSRYFNRMGIHDSGVYFWGIQNAAGDHFAIYGPGPQTNFWDHLVGTFDGSTLKFYVNNVYRGQAVFTGSLPTVTNDVAIAFREAFSDLYFTGSVDEIGFWNRAITVDEISDLYNNGVGRAWDSTFTCVKDHPTLLSGMLSCHNMDGNVADATGNAHDGTIVGSPKYASGKVGKALTVSSGNYVNMQNSTGLNPSYISIAAWAKRSSSTDTGAIVGRDYCYALHGYGTNQVEWLCRMSNGGYYAAPQQTWNTGSWDFIVGAVDSSNVKISVNGGDYVLSGGHGGLTCYQGAYNTQIGAGGLASNEYVDTVMIWDRPIDQSEIKDLYNFGNGLPWYIREADINTSATLKNGLIAHYALEGNVNDSYDSHNGTAEKYITTVVGKVRNAISFDGPNDSNAYNIGTYQALNLGQILAGVGSFSFAAWVNLNAGTYPQVVSIDGYYPSQQHPEARFYFCHPSGSSGNAGIEYFGTSGVVSASTPWAVGSWVHWAFTVDYNVGSGVTTLKLYKNGVLASTGTGSIGGPKTSTLPLLVGAKTYGSGTPTQRAYLANGKIDEPALWSRALTPIEIAQLYNEGIGIAYDKTFTCISNHPTLRSDMLAHWRFDSGIGDASGNGATGEDTGTPTYVPGKVGNAIRYGKDGKHIWYDPAKFTSYWTRTAFSYTGWVYIEEYATIEDYASLNIGGKYDNTWVDWWLNATGEDPSGWVNKKKFGCEVDNTVGGYVGVVSIDQYSLNTWYHLAMTFDGTYLNFWVNGVFQGSSSAFSGTRNTSDSHPFRQGMHGMGTEKINLNNNWIGYFRADGFSFHARALDESEVLELYNAGNGLTWYPRETEINTSATLKTGLLSYYTLDSNANDSSGNARHGTEVGTPTYAIAKLRSGLVLNGTSQYDNLGTTADFAPTTGISASIWVYFDSTTSADQSLILGKYYWGIPWTNKSWGLIFTKSTNTLAASIVWGPTVGVDYFSAAKAGLTSFANAWHHIALTYDKSILLLYLDGQEIARVTGCHDNPLSNNVPVYIGSYWNQDTSTRYYTKGKFDEAAIWSRALTSVEVAQLYNEGIGITWDKTFTCISDHPTIQSGLICHYSLNGDCKDDTANALDGTLVGTVAYTQGKLKKAPYWESQSGCYRLPLGSGIFDKNYISLSVWCMPTGQVDWMNAVARWCVTGENGDYELSLDNSNPRRMRFVAAGASGTVYLPTDPEAIPNNLWTHFSGTYNGVAARLYRNGSLATYTSAPEILKHSNASLPVWIGTRENESSPPYPGNPMTAERWIGRIDEVLIHDRALDSTEVTDLYNGGFGLPWRALPVDINTHATLKNNLVAYWTLNSGGADSHTNNLPLTIAGSPEYVSAKLRTGMHLTTDGQKGTRTGGGLFEVNGNRRTYSIWFYPHSVPTSGNTVRLIGQSYDIGAGVLQITNPGSGPKLQFATRINPGWWPGSVDGPIIAANTWNHAVVVLERIDETNSQCRMYVNGTWYNSTGYLSTAHFDANIITGDIYVGANGSDGACRFDGIIDDIGFWNWTKTDAEIYDLWNDGAGITWDATHAYVSEHPSLPYGLVGAWPLDRGGEDVSGNANHGALIAFPSKVAGKLGNAYDLGTSAKNLYFDYTSFYSKFGTASFSFAIWNKALAHPSGGDPNWYQGIVTIAGCNPGGADAVRFQFGQFSASLGGSFGAGTGISVRNTGNTYYGPSTPYSTTGEWVFWIVVVDDANKLVTLYQNGKCVGSVPFTGTLADPSKPLRVGYKSSGASPQTPTTIYPLDIEKIMDNFIWWNRPLTESEVRDLYRAGTGLAYAAAATPPTQVYGTDLATGLIGYYREESDSSDSSGNNRNGTEVGSPTHALCKVDNGIVLNGISQRVNLGTSTDFCPTTGLSVFGWIYIDSTQSQALSFIFNRYTAEDINNYSWSVTYDKTNSILYGWVNCPEGYWETSVSSVSFLVNGWNYVGFAYDKSVLCLYVNGNEVARKTGCSGNPRATSIETEFGHRYNSTLSQHWWMKGKIDEVGIWARSVPQSQVLDLYNLGNGLLFSTYTPRAPRVRVSATILSQNQVRLDFDELMNHNAALSLASNYQFSGPTTLTPTTITPEDTGGETHCTIQFTGEMKTGGSYHIHAINMIDSNDGLVVDADHDTADFTGSGVAPQVSSVEAHGQGHIKINFNELMTHDAALSLASNYHITGPTTLTPTSATPSDSGVTTVDLLFTGNATVGAEYQVEVVGVCDLATNIVDPAHDTGTWLGEMDKAQISSIVATTSTKVRVSYNREMKHDNPGNLDDSRTSTNYVFTGGDIPLVATDVLLIGHNPTIVDVVVNEQLEGQAYHLKVNNVEDVISEQTLDPAYDEGDFEGVGGMPQVENTAVESEYDWLKIRFSEPVGDSALVKENYEIEPLLSILGVQKITDYVYKVTTEPQLPGLDYTLTVFPEVKDLGGNPMDPDHDEVSFRGKYSDIVPYDYFSSAGGVKWVGPVEGAGVAIVEVLSEDSDENS